MGTRIGIVTGGGDCPGLNAVIRAVAKAGTYRGWETVGIEGGFEGLLSPRQTCELDYHALDGLLTRGGTILGTANRGRFSAKTGHGETRDLPTDLLNEARGSFEDLGLSGLVAVGGDGLDGNADSTTNGALEETSITRDAAGRILTRTDGVGTADERTTT